MKIKDKRLDPIEKQGQYEGEGYVPKQRGRGDSNRYDLFGFYLKYYHGHPRVVIYGWGKRSWGIRAPYMSSRLPGSFVFNNAEDALNWLKEAIDSGKYVEGQSISNAWNMTDIPVSSPGNFTFKDFKSNAAFKRLKSEVLKQYNRDGEFGVFDYDRY